MLNGMKYHQLKVQILKEIALQSKHLKDLKKEKLPICVSKGYLLSQSKGITRIFTDYILNKDKPTFDTIGNTCIIPTAVIQSIKKIH